MTAKYNAAADYHQCMKCGEHVCMEPGHPDSICDCKPPKPRASENWTDMATRRQPGVWATRIREALGR